MKGIRDRRTHIEALADSLSSDHARAWFYMLLARTSVLALVAVLASSCAYISKVTKGDPKQEPEVVLIEGRDAEFTVTCTDVFVTELDRPREQPWGPGDNGLEACLDLARKGYSKQQLVEWARSSPEYPEVLERREARAREAKEADEQRKREEEEREKNRGQLRGRLRAEGQIIVDASGQPFVEPFASTLTLLIRTPAERAAVLDEVSGLGFRGVRVFAGRLFWDEQLVQSPTQALAALPAVLQETAARGLYILVTALTDTRDGGYDEEAHVRMAAALTAGYAHAVVEIANEAFHGTQSLFVNDYARLCSMAERVMAGYPNLWALSAAPLDYPLNGRYTGACGPVSTSHLDRSGSNADRLARVAGLAQTAGATSRPVISSEPIGAGEVSGRGRLADPGFFGELAHQQASLGILGVFHSEDGLHARPLGPLQKEAARAFVAGYRRPARPVVVPPPPSCAEKRDAKAIVACQRASWGRMSPSAVATFLHDIARDLNAAGVPGGLWGVLIKRSGNSCDGISCDIVCSGNGPDQRQYDVLTDSEGAQKPVWARVERIAVRTCEPVR